MRLVVDSCVAGLVAAALREAGHDVEWTGDWPADPGDEAILQRARAERRAIVTLDKDFGELAVVRGLAHYGILRLVDIRVRDQAQATTAAIRRFGPQIEAGAIVTIEPNRTRVRPPAE